MAHKFLPSLKKVQIKNFSLYPEAPDQEINYDFVEGINLVIGGNGVGKTTFLNIIKYALLGLYKKEIDVKRREYKGTERRYDKRTNLPYDFFKSRSDETIVCEENAEVALWYSLGDISIKVKRDLFEPKIISASFHDGKKDTQLTGEPILQKDYDLSFSEKDKAAEAEKTLQGEYEKIVGKFSGFDFFDNLIFIVNEVLFFNESRKTIMWDKDVQHTLSSKFLIDPEKDRAKEDLNRNGKYFDSLSRHKSEEGKAIRRMLEKFDGSDSSSNEYKKLAEEIEIQKDEMNSLYKSIEEIHKERKIIEHKISAGSTAKNKIISEIESLNGKKLAEEKNLYADAYERITPKYIEYVEFLKSSSDCPLCNQKVENSLYSKLVNNPDNCILCCKPIRKSKDRGKNIDILTASINDNINKLRNKEKDIISLEEDLRKLDTRFSKLSEKQNQAAVKLRKSEFEFQKFQSNNKESGDTEFKVMKQTLDELNKEKEENLKKSKIAYDKARKIGIEIDRQLTKKREFLSNIFDDFGGLFLGQTCSLVFEDPGDGKGKRYFPKINDKIRYSEEELSESQRFFIDQAFRMSLISLLNEGESFFMCETPDSSLDISYEQNAAKIFLKYVENSNTLILTSNLNNSEFLDYVITNATRKNAINLLTIGKKSTIQASSNQLIEASKKIERQING